MFDIRYKSHHDVKNVIEKMMKRKIVTPFTFNRVLKEKPLFWRGIYVHTPYCDKICSFCNMNRKQIDNDLNDYTDYLCKEFKKYGEKKYIKEKKSLQFSLAEEHLQYIKHISLKKFFLR